VEGYDPSKPTSYINYLDANNLYDNAMSNLLPVGKFQFLSQTEIDHFDLMFIPPDGDTGYIIECDLIFPDYLHPLHSDYPLAPEYLTVNVEMLGRFASQFIDKERKSSKKLIPNLHNKNKYVTHCRNLQFYLNHGLIVTKFIEFYHSNSAPGLNPGLITVRQKEKWQHHNSSQTLLNFRQTPLLGKRWSRSDIG